MTLHCHLIPTIHPAALLHGGKPIADVIRMDLAKANRVSWEGPRQEENLIIAHPASPVGQDESVRLALEWMRKWRREKCSVAVDIETSSLNYFSCRLYSIALSGDDGCNAAVAFTLGDLHTLPWALEEQLVGEMHGILADPDVPTLYHNAPFDCAVLIKRNFQVVGLIEDTLGFHHLVQPDIPHTLDWIGHTYLDVEPWKLDHTGKKQAFTRNVIELLVYNAKDAINTMKLRRPLIEAVHQRGMTDELIGLQMDATQLAIDMEIAGLPVNHAKRAEMGEQRRTELDSIKAWLRDYLKWPDFNPMNKGHAVDALYGAKYVGLTPTVWTPKTKQPSTKYEDIIDHMSHEFVWRFVKYVEMHHAWATMYADPNPAATSKSTMTQRFGGAYFRAFQMDGRLHPSWSAYGQMGSRFTSKPNVQNQPVPDRVFFEAPEGRILVGADLDQLELRLAAALAGVPMLLEEMAKVGGDPHTLAARNIYPDFDSRTPEERKKLRDAVKNVVYASLYRAGIKTVHKTLRKKKFLDPALRAALTLDVVAHIYHSYFGRFVEFVVYHDRNYDLAQTQGFLEIPTTGRRRYFPVQPPPFTEVANYQVQTLGSDEVLKCMLNIKEELRSKYKGSASIILHGHDAVYIECNERDGEDVLAIVNHLFGNTIIEGPAGPVRLTCAGKVGRTIKDVK